MVKSLKNELIIKNLSLKIMAHMRKFAQIAKISKQNRIISKKSSF